MDVGSQAEGKCTGACPHSEVTMRERLINFGAGPAMMPEAVLPCVISLIVEAVWFAILTKYIDRMWPPKVSTDELLTAEAQSS